MVWQDFEAYYMVTGKITEYSELKQLCPHLFAAKITTRGKCEKIFFCDFGEVML